VSAATLVSSVNAVLRDLMCDELAMEYNLEGHKKKNTVPKDPLKDTTFHHLVVGRISKASAF